MFSFMFAKLESANHRRACNETAAIRCVLETKHSQTRRVRQLIAYLSFLPSLSISAANAVAVCAANGRRAHVCRSGLGGVRCVAGAHRTAGADRSTLNRFGEKLRTDQVLQVLWAHGRNDESRHLGGKGCSCWLLPIGKSKKSAVSSDFLAYVHTTEAAARSDAERPLRPSSARRPSGRFQMRFQTIVGGNARSAFLDAHSPNEQDSWISPPKELSDLAGIRSNSLQTRHNLCRLHLNNKFRVSMRQRSP